MFGNIYKNRRVLVTGHTGFKGAWLTLWLIKLSANVVGYSLEPPTKPNLFESIKIKNKIKHIIGDVRDLDHLKKICNQYKPEIIFHLAAQAIVKKSYENPHETFETNVMGTINILEAVRKCQKTRAVINVTSDKCYENKELVYGHKESDPLGGHDPYSASKGCSELVTASYRQSFFGQNNPVGISSVRAGNVIGGGDWAPDRLIPDCINALVNKRTIILRNPQSIRPWQHVLEPLSGYLWLGLLLFKEPSKFSEAWNFGPKDEDALSVRQVVEKIIEIWGKGSIKINKEKFHESKSLKLDINRARNHLEWKPVYYIDNAIINTVNWYKEYYLKSSKNLFDFSLNQIKAYEKQASTENILWSKK